MSTAAVMAGAGLLFPLGANTATSRGVTLQGGATGAYGPYVELSPSLPCDMCGITVMFENSSIGYKGRFCLAIGASGSEVIIADSIPVAFPTSQGFRIYLPLAFPKGARLSIAIEHQSSSRNVDCAVNLVPAHPWHPAGYSYAVGFGWSLADSGATANTWSPYVNMTTNLPAGVKCIGYLVGQNSSNTGSNVIASVEYDGLEIGQQILRWAGFQGHTDFALLIPGSFAPGKTVRARHQCDQTASNSGRNLYHAAFALG